MPSFVLNLRAELQKLLLQLIPEAAKCLKNFANAVLNGEKLIAPGEEGIKGLTISNAIHLSSWTGEEIKLSEFSDDKFYDMLQDKIKKSTYVKKVRETGNVDISKTH